MKTSNNLKTCPSFIEIKLSWGVSMEYRLHKLAEYVRGWMNNYGISEYYRPVPIVNEWLRRKIRMCFWKQWRYTRTKVYKLLKLGTFTRQTIMTALSRKGPWHLGVSFLASARTIAAQTGMTNKWLKELGLISVKDQWVEIHYPASA